MCGGDKVSEQFSVLVLVTFYQHSMIMQTYTTIARGIHRYEAADTVAQCAGLVILAFLSWLEQIEIALQVASKRFKVTTFNTIFSVPV